MLKRKHQQIIEMNLSKNYWLIEEKYTQNVYTLCIKMCPLNPTLEL